MPPNSASERSRIARRLWNVLPYRVRREVCTTTDGVRADLEWIRGLRGLRLPVLWFHWRARRLARRTGDHWSVIAATPPYDLQALLRLARGRKRVVEIGTGAGWTALTLALDDPERRVTTYDPTDRGRERYARLVPSMVRDRINFLSAPGSAGPSEPDTEHVELVYIDSSHEREATLEEITAWLPHLAPGTLVVFDDFDNSEWPGVSEAIRALGLTGEQEASLFVYRHETSETAH